MAAKGQQCPTPCAFPPSWSVGSLSAVLIGWALDRWLGNEKPWLFILFFLLGAAAGILNVVRMAAKDNDTDRRHPRRTTTTTSRLGQEV